MNNIDLYKQRNVLAWSYYGQSFVLTQMKQVHSSFAYWNCIFCYNDGHVKQADNFSFNKIFGGSFLVYLFNVI